MQIDRNRINDEEYMKANLRRDSRVIFYLGDKLRNNPQFMLENVEYMFEDGVWYKDVYRVLGESLRYDKEFLALYIEKIAEVKHTRDLEDILYGMRIERGFFQNDIEFWDKMKKIGLIKSKLDCARYRYSNITYKKVPITNVKEREECAQKRMEFIFENLDKITKENFRDWVFLEDISEQGFMLKFVELNPDFYLVADESLKNDPQFIRKAIEINPEVEKIIEEEKNSVKREREVRENAKKEKIEEEYKKLGNNHPNLILVKNF